MTTLSEEELHHALTDLFFKASGGVSDMAKDEVDQALTLFSQTLAQREKEYKLKLAAKEAKFRQREVLIKAGHDPDFQTPEQERNKG